MLQKIPEHSEYQTRLVQCTNQIVVRFLSEHCVAEFKYDMLSCTGRVTLFSKTDLTEPEHEDAKQLLILLLTGQSLNQIGEKVEQEVGRYNKWVPIHNKLVEILKENGVSLDSIEMSIYDWFSDGHPQWCSKGWTFEEGMLYQVYHTIFVFFQDQLVDYSQLNKKNFQKTISSVKDIIKENETLCKTLIQDKKIQNLAYGLSRFESERFWNCLVGISVKIGKCIREVMQMNQKKIGRDQLFLLDIMRD